MLLRFSPYKLRGGMRYADRTVIITGGTQGIGEGCARVFAAEGASVWIASPDEARGARVAEEITAAGPGRARFVCCDVTRDADRLALVSAAVDANGRLDCLVNNAGWHPPHYPIDGFSLDDFRALLELNVVSVFRLCQLALPHLRRTRGSIVNVASLVATIGQHHATTYVATKGAVLAFTKALAVDEATHGVRVNSISPGNVYTPLWQQAIDAAPDGAAARAAGDAAQVMGRMGTPEEVGRLCLFLAADATFTTGVDHIISGGAEIGYGRKA
jgi:NAD(P)-dependent dehydrogenase (short-subunit alcohol dehydrogenase family)